MGTGNCGSPAFVIRAHCGARQHIPNRNRVGVFKGVDATRIARKRAQERDTIMSKPRVDIYTTFTCPFCYRAKRLLDSKGVKYNEFDISMGGPKRQEMLARAPGARTVPQIFIGDHHVGGSDELAALERGGSL